MTCALSELPIKIKEVVASWVKRANEFTTCEVIEYRRGVEIKIIGTDTKGWPVVKIMNIPK